jgi:hypothetical protein
MVIFSRITKPLTFRQEAEGRRQEAGGKKAAMLEEMSAV